MTEGLASMVRRLRLQRDMTLEALAERSGVSDRSIGDIERGVTSGPRRATIVALADGLELLGNERHDLIGAARSARAPDADADAHGVSPLQLLDFAGRAAELARVTAYLSGALPTRTVPTAIVVSGSPGTGKTSLALEAVRRSAPSPLTRLFVDLGAQRARPLTALQVLRELLRQLTGGQDGSRTFAEASDAWGAATRRSPVVVVLDDAGLEAQVRPVLGFGSESRAIVTSRRPLAGLEGAEHLPLDVLSRKESVSLLHELLQDPKPDEDRLAELAALCGDLPLALRIAAGRVNAQSPRTVEDYIEQLSVRERRLKSLVAGDRAVEAAFATSYQLLGDRAREQFRLLALLPATSFAPASVAAVQGSDDQLAVLDVLEELEDLGLVQPLRHGRFRLHDLLHLYASDRLREEVPEAEVRAHEQRLQRWLLSTAAAAGSRFDSERRSSAPARTAPILRFETDEHARSWLMAEADSWFTAFRGAAAAGEYEAVVVAALPVVHIMSEWPTWGRWHEFAALGAAAAAAVDDRDAMVELTTAVAYAYIEEMFQPELALTTARRALELGGPSVNRRVRAWCWMQVAGSARHLGRVEQAADACREALAAVDPIEDADLVLSARADLGRLLIADDPAGAEQELREVLALLEHSPMSEADRLGGSWVAHLYLGRSLIAQQRWDEEVLHSTSLIERGHRDAAELARAHRNRGFAHLGAGDIAAGHRDLRTALALAGEHRPDWWAAEIEAALGG